MVNPNPEDNSDFDTESEIDPEKYMNTEIVMEHSGISSENYLKNRKINLSIIGRPNAGKSSLVNTFLENEKVLASDVSHTTTDTTSHIFTHKGVKLNLIDTAGIEKSSKKKKNVQQLIFKKTMRAIKGSQCIIVLIDALEAFRNIDFDLVNLCIKEGRPIVLVVNKWDLVAEKWKERAAKFMKVQVEQSLGILNNVPIHFISATESIRTKRVLDSVLDVYTGWNKRISTGLLNNWLDRFKRVQKMPT
jgi:GTP-binding protein